MAEPTPRMRLLYNILFTVFFALSAPWYLWKLIRRGNWRGGFAQRFGWHDAQLKQELADRRVLWLHAVSVGEANLCVGLVQALRPEFPDWEIVVTTTTTTGMAELRKKLPTPVRHLYYPIDFTHCVRAALNAIQPDAIILVETELWPNLLWQAADRGIPVCLANARLSDKSARGYRCFGFLFRSLLSELRAVVTPDDSDRDCLIDLGCRPAAVHAVGNLKFDDADATLQGTLDVSLLFRELGVDPGAPVLVGGSTHEGEERLLISAWKKFRDDHPGLLLILVPRHQERVGEVAAQLRTAELDFIRRSQLPAMINARHQDALRRARAAGLDFVRRSELDGQRESPPDCLLVDTTGEMKLFLETATVVFMGKSLTARGGQNPIEPAALGRPVVFGPNMQNFRGVVKTLLAAEAAVQVDDAAGLETELAALLADERRRDTLGRNARAVVRKNQGATQRTAGIFRHVLRTP